MNANGVNSKASTDEGALVDVHGSLTRRVVVAFLVKYPALPHGVAVTFTLETETDAPAPGTLVALAANIPGCYGWLTSLVYEGNLYAGGHPIQFSTVSRLVESKPLRHIVIIEENCDHLGHHVTRVGEIPALSGDQVHLDVAFSHILMPPTAQPDEIPDAFTNGETFGRNA